MIGETGPGDYRPGYGLTLSDISLSVFEAISTKESQGGYTNDPDNLAVYLYEDLTVTDRPNIPMTVVLAETITLVEFLRVGRNLGLRKSETINLDENVRLYSPLKILLQVFETIHVVDITPTLRPPQLRVSLAETITVTEGGLNSGVSGSSSVIGPAPAPLVIADDYWTVGI